jgi:hypothetical protein
VSGIAIAVITAVLIAVATAGVTGGLSTIRDWIIDETAATLPAEAIDSWEFVGYESAPPTSDMAVQIDRVTFHDEDSYSAVGRMMFGNGGSLPMSNSGTLEMEDENTVRFTPSGEESTFAILDLEVEGNELRLTDNASGATSVFRRVGD